MNIPMSRSALFLAALVSISCTLQSISAEPVVASPAPAQPVMTAALEFIATLDENQRRSLQYGFQDDAERKRWSNFPVSVFKRGGLRLADLSQNQRKAALSVIAAALSPEGYQKVLQIMDGDELLKQNDRDKAMFGRDLYYIAFVGKPSLTDPWMIQFGGHHLGLNITFVGEQTTLTPSHTGAQPAVYQLEGKTVRPLGRESDKAFVLMSSLDDDQRKQAILGFEVRDLVLGPGRDGEIIQPEGIKGSALTQKQREMLLDVAREWIGMMSEGAARSKMDEMKNNIEETWFAWSGPTEKGSAAYFRIQGPTVIIEYAPQRMGGNPGNHIHTVYRDPTNDYGAKWWKR
jgi:Protein of unknown function (DUF3500)